MPCHPLFSDKTIALSSTLAATIGLEEAVLLTVLNDAASIQSQTYAKLSKVALRNSLPFWNDDTIRRVLQSLLDKGLLVLSGPMFPEADGLIFSFSAGQTIKPSRPQTLAQTTAQATSQAPTKPQMQRPAINPQATAMANQQQTPVAPMQPHIQAPRANYAPRTMAPTQPLPERWQPAADTLTRLEQHGIPSAFAWTQLDTFILQAHEQGANRNDWNARFFRHVKSQWVFANNDANRQQRGERTAFNPTVGDEPTRITFDWKPANEAVQILQRAGIDPHFITDAVPEFVLYWSEEGSVQKAWNSKFVNHVRLQWARFSSAMEHSTQPTRMTDNWQPSPDCFDIIGLAHIDANFAKQLIPEFILYWRDSNQLQTSWNSTFLKYVKQQWGKRLASTSGDSNGQQTNQPGYATAQASLQRLKDTSW